MLSVSLSVCHSLSLSFVSGFTVIDIIVIVGCCLASVLLAYFAGCIMQDV